MYESSSPSAMGAMIPLLVFAGAYFYFAYCVVKMAYKLDHDKIAWWGWVPIMNTLLLVKMANKPSWWFFLMLVPIVNLFVFFKLWMDIAKALGQSAIWGFLVMIPVIQLVALGILAFSGGPNDRVPAGSAPMSPAHKREPIS